MLDLFYSNLKTSLLQTYEIQMKAISGFYFLYVHSVDDYVEVQHAIRSVASILTKKRMLSFECEYVRSTNQIHVFRFRFLVPSEKMFCCGNGCIDCTRL
ncbi:hypothetical protein [Alkalicoccobacillus murimartini]|uniref:Uncharacterized protein n=1 Tax=Alkalicoccobacillus murimartini TaxID=171685 RepID=A0ABT9YFI0_9BACI|nr:hypothetical protein [Alkalicoccobacillus murimartini]MDQ0206469.1 hypothetical protein [Alkalicoccobacillus murimartini]